MSDSSSAVKKTVRDAAFPPMEEILLEWLLEWGCFGFSQTAFDLALTRALISSNKSSGLEYLGVVLFLGIPSLSGCALSSDTISAGVNSVLVEAEAD